MNKFLFLLFLWINGGHSFLFVQSVSPEKPQTDKYAFVSCFDDAGLALVGKKAKLGYFNLQGKLLIPFEYDNGLPFSEGKVAVKKGNKWGYLDSLNQVVLPFIYDSAFSFFKGIALVKQAEHYNVIDEKGRIVDTLDKREITNGMLNRYETLSISQLQGFYQQNWRYYWSEDGSKKGVVEIGSHRVIVPAIYKELYPIPYFRQPVFEVVKENEERGSGKRYFYHATTKREIFTDNFSLGFPRLLYVNEKGNFELLDTGFHTLHIFDKEENVRETNIGNIFCVNLVDSSQQETVVNIYNTPRKKIYSTNPNPNDEDGDGNIYGINSSACGKPSANAPFNYTTSENDSLLFQPKIRIGLKNRQGKWIVAPNYTGLKEFNEHYALFYHEKNWHFVSLSSGKELFQIPYHHGQKISLSMNKRGTCFFSNAAGKMGAVDTLGNIIVPFEYKEVFEFLNKGEMIRVRQGDNYGLFDAKGKQILACNYPKISPMVEHGLIAVAKGVDKLGFISLQGKWVIPPIHTFRWDTILSERYPSFYEGWVYLGKSEKWGFYDTLGKLRVPFQFKGDAFTFEEPERENGFVQIKTEEGQAIILNKEGKRLQLPRGASLYSWKNHYDSAFPTNCQPFVTRQGYGLLNEKGEIIIPDEHQNPMIYSVEGKGSLGLWESPKMKFGLINEAGKEVLAPEYEYIGHRYFPTNVNTVTDEWGNPIVFFDWRKNERYILKKGKIGILDQQGKEKIAPLYETISDEKGGNETNPERKIAKKGEYYGLLDTNGKVLLPFVYSYLFFNGNGYIVKKGKSFGFVNRRYQEVIPCNKSFVQYLHEGWLWVIVGNKVGIMDTTGKWVLKPIPTKLKEIEYNTLTYYNLDDYGTTGAVILKGKSFQQLITSNGKLHPQKYDKVERKVTINREKNKIIGSYFYVTKEGKMGVLDKDCKTVLATKYDLVLPVAKTMHRFLVKKEGNWLLMNEKEIVLTQANYDTLFSCSNNQLLFSQNKQWGIMDTNGKEIAPASYDDLKPLSTSYYQVLGAGKYGLIDSLGRLLLPAIYENIYGIRNLVFVLVNGKKQLFIRKGDSLTFLADIEQSAVGYQNFLVLKVSGKCGVIDMQGKWLLPPEYEGISPIAKNFLLLKNGCKYGLADDTGKIIVPIEYEGISALGDQTFSLLTSDKISVYFHEIRKIESYPLSAIISGLNIDQHLIYLKVGENAGILKENGTFLLPFEKQTVGFGKGYIRVYREGKVRYIDGFGKDVFVCE
ncbi:MAG: WG repeat-containing protein [Bacteroidia bacterium]